MKIVTREEYYKVNDGDLENNVRRILYKNYNT